MTATPLSRDPGEALREALRREVNFGCPVRFTDDSGCGSPVLVYHHFDPPWAGHKQHSLEGMIALCPLHHAQADGGAWTIAQLREMKRHPYVDDRLKVQWPYQTETLVIKVGRSLVVGSGSPIRLNGRPVLDFRPTTIQDLGIKTITFDADIRDRHGAPWLRISDSWFDLSLERTTDVQFAPHMSKVVARHDDRTAIRLRFRRYALKDVKALLGKFIDNHNDAASACATIERAGAVDSDGLVPMMTLMGSFRTPEVEVTVTGHTMRFTSSLPGLQETFDWHGWVVDAKRRVVLKYEGREFFSLG